MYRHTESKIPNKLKGSFLRCQVIKNSKIFLNFRLFVYALDHTFIIVKIKYYANSNVDQFRIKFQHST